MTKLIYLGMLLLVAAPLLLQAQSAKEWMRRADYYLDRAQYDKALTALQEVQNRKEDTKGLAFKLGRSYFEEEQYQAAARAFAQHLAQSKDPIVETYHYLARCAHLQGKYGAALIYYKDYLRLSETEAPLREITKVQLQRCAAARYLTERRPIVVSNLGAPINTKADEWAPIFHPQQSNRLYYASNRYPVVGGRRNADMEIDNEKGRLRYDIFQSNLEKGNWTAGTPLSERYNTAFHDIPISFLEDGYELVLYRGENLDEGTLIKDNFDDDSVSFAFRVSAPLQSATNWDGDFYLVHDSLLLFASERSGGYGGKDLYYSLKQADKWQMPQNLGPQVNGPLDERSPFLTKNGKQLFFSSNRIQSLGGYDLFQSTFSDSSLQWLAPEHLGQPLNSPADELFYRIYDDGLQGLFVSNRAGGQGGFDFYQSYYRRPLAAQTDTTGQLFVQTLTAEEKPAQKVNPFSIEEVRSKLEPERQRKGANSAPHYVLGPIFYDAATGDMATSQKTLRQLASLLKAYPEAKVLLTAHSDNVGPLYNNLFLSIKQAETLQRRLIQNGAEAEQILMRGMGPNYPIAKNEGFGGAPNPAGQSMNRRITFELYELPEEVGLRLEEPVVSEVMQAKDAQRLPLLDAGLSFRIELTEANTLLRHPLLESSEHVLTEQRPNEQQVRYLMGWSKSWKGILFSLSEAKKAGFENARPIPYYNGRRLSRKEALALAEEKTDLLDYLEFVQELE